MIKTRFDEPRWLQSLLQLTRTVIIEQRRRLVCIPDRMQAQNERDRLARQYGQQFSDPKISKNGKGPQATYTLSYTLKETRTETLF